MASPLIALLNLNGPNLLNLLLHYLKLPLLLLNGFLDHPELCLLGLQLLVLGSGGGTRIVGEGLGGSLPLDASIIELSKCLVDRASEKR